MAGYITTATLYFKKPGPGNTEDCLAAAARRAGELGLKKVIIASYSGDTAFKALNHFHIQDAHLLVVTQVMGFQRPDEQVMPESVLQELKAKGFQTIRAAHAFGGVGRGLRNKLGTYQVDEIMAFTLRMFGQGVKVGVEMALMCADAGLVRTDEDVITISGTAKGADTAMVVKPSNSHTCLELKIREIITKPRQP